MLSPLLTAAQRVPGWWKMSSLLLPGIAAWHRRRLDSVTFVAITGSAGKTTAKMLATAVLATAGRVQARGGNRVDKIMSSLCSTRPDERFCIIEMGADKPGARKGVGEGKGVAV